MLLAALTLAPLPAAAQDSGTAIAEARAIILRPGAVVNTADMDFGGIARPQSAGTVVLSPAAAATCTVTGGLIRSGACQAAAFTLLATQQGRARFNHPGNGTVTLTGPGAATMLITNLTLGVSGMTPRNGGGNANLGRFDITTQSGIADFWLGGTLQVNAGQAPGVYQGSVVIEVQFN